MDVSVIMAVYNRAELIPDLLDSWRAVDKASNYTYELIFSDDESSDDSARILEECTDLPIRVIRNAHGGASSARNAAYPYATGQIVIFTGDDIFPGPDFVNLHYETFLKNGDGFATLGRIDWRQGIQMTYLMRHITEIGCEQFGFIGMNPYETIDFRHFYTSNISVARSRLEDLGVLFDRRFERYGFEDIELGYRLYKNGVSIYYNPDILALHDHVYSSVDKFCARQISAGMELNTFKKLHPELSADEIKTDIDEFNECYSRYVQKQILFDPFVAMGRFFIFAAKKSTFFCEKLIKKGGSYKWEALCSKLYTAIFAWSFFYGLAMNHPKLPKNPKTSARFAWRYLSGGKSQIFFNKNNEFSEDRSRIRHLCGERRIEISFDLPREAVEVRRVRFDPLDNKCRIRICRCEIRLFSGNTKRLEFEYVNARKSNNGRYDFSNTIDPFMISALLPEDAQTVEIEYIVRRNLLQRLWSMAINLARLIFSNRKSPSVA